MLPFSLLPSHKLPGTLFLSTAGTGDKWWKAAMSFGPLCPGTASPWGTVQKPSERDPLVLAAPGTGSMSPTSYFSSHWATLTLLSFGVNESHFLFEIIISTGFSSCVCQHHAWVSTPTSFKFARSAWQLKCSAFLPISLVSEQEEFPVSGVKGRARAKGPQEGLSPVFSSAWC